MNFRKAQFLVLLTCLCAASADATPLFANLIKIEIPPNSTQVPLPYFMDGTNDILFLKFGIPNFDQIAAINAFIVDVTFYDDGDGGGESGDIEIAQPATNLVLGGFTTLNHFTSSSPADFVVSLCPCEIATIGPSLQDGNFRIRIQRDTGDFYVAGGLALLDVTYVPEPASIGFVSAGLLGLALLNRKLRRIC